MELLLLILTLVTALAPAFLPPLSLLLQQVSPDDSPPQTRRAGYSGERDYTRPLPPSYRRAGDPSPSRHSYHDSAYSSHSSHSSDNPAFSVLPSERRPPLSTQSSPAKSYSRQNSFNYDANPRINSRTFRKQKSPQRNRSPSLSPSRFIIVIITSPSLSSTSSST